MFGFGFALGAVASIYCLIGVFFSIMAMALGDEKRVPLWFLFWPVMFTIGILKRHN
jgi:hypothetical protein